LRSTRFQFVTEALRQSNESQNSAVANRTGNRKKKRICRFLAKLGCIPQRLQHAVDERTAQIVGRAWLRVCHSFTGRTFSIQTAQPIFAGGKSKTPAYLLRLRPQSFIIIARPHWREGSQRIDSSKIAPPRLQFPNAGPD
jgi:hypothetical protein